MGRGHDGGKDLHISSLSEHIDLDQKQAEESSPCGVARVGATQKSSGDPHLTGNQGRGRPRATIRAGLRVDGIQRLWLLHPTFGFLPKKLSRK
jgi:hypothetical protein